MASGRKRPRGGSLLDGLMADVAQLHRSAAAPRAVFDDDVESAPHHCGPPPARHLGPGGPQVRETCRNAECGRSEFEVDGRRGDRICLHCGTVQNARSMESLEEEHRSFADDDKGHLKKRAERPNRDGKAGSTRVDRSLQRAARLAESGEQSEMPPKEASRQDKYVGAVA